LHAGSAAGLHRTNAYSSRGAAMVGHDAWVALGLVQGLMPRRAFALAERLGGPEALLDASPAQLRALDVPDALAARIAGARAQGAREQQALGRLGAHTIGWSDPAYPTRLREIAEPPLALAVRGGFEPDEPAVAIVGARRAGEYGRRIAHELAVGMAQAGITVVSGLAAGIDGAAHRGAIDGGGRTIAVMATGIDAVYPGWHRALAQDVAARGALVTEFPIGTPPLKQHFPRRNRIVAGLSLGVVVIEAAEQSGSLISARLALEQGREVFAVPGQIDRPGSAGPHRLLRDGAKLVTCVDDILEELGHLPAAAPDQRGGTIRAAAELKLNDIEHAVLQAIDPGGSMLDDVAAACGLPIHRVLSTVSVLESRRLVRKVGGSRVARI
jgi:DNA processing protein